MADARDSKSRAERHEGSTPSLATIKNPKRKFRVFNNLFS